MLDHLTSTRRRAVLGLMLLTFVSAGVGFGLALTSPEMPGAEPMTLEDVVDAVAMLGFGVLGTTFIRRRTAEGLGRALVLLAALSAANYLLSGVAQTIANGEPTPPAVAQLLSLGAEAAFIATFFLLAVAPMLLFPTGRLPSRRWRWPARAVVVGCVASMLSVLLTPGPVDEDNPAWGDNPIGVAALGDIVDSLELVGLLFLALGVLTGLAAFITRWARYRGVRRQQMAWFTVGVVVLVAGLVTEVGGSVAVEVATALAIFGSLFVGMGWPLLGPLGTAAETADDADPVAHDQPPAGAVHHRLLDRPSSEHVGGA
jgi:hypothetical protein